MPREGGGVVEVRVVCFLGLFREIYSEMIFLNIAQKYSDMKFRYDIHETYSDIFRHSNRYSNINIFMYRKTTNTNQYALRNAHSKAGLETDCQSNQYED